MSAFLVEDKTINRIVSYIQAEAEKSQWVMNKVNKFYLDNMPLGTWDTLAQALYDMNIEAVNCRYQEENDKRTVKYIPSYSDKYQILKSLKCYLYQCSEGDIDKKPLFIFLDSFVKVHLMSDIITNSEAYDMAEWE